MIALALCALAQEDPSLYRVDYLVPPNGARIEVGGIAFLDDGRLALSTRRGQVWMVENALASDPAEAEFSLFADGLFEGLGLHAQGDELFVLQRGELSRLWDRDGDGRAEEVETLCDAWGLSGNYHEFAFGLPRDAGDDFYIGLNLGFFDPAWWVGQSNAPWRGWVLRIDAAGMATPYASGFRSPCGLHLDPDGRLLVTDNQGDWVAASPIHHVQAGGFHGHPASLGWRSEWIDAGEAPSLTQPPAIDPVPPAVWIPYEWSQSTGNLTSDTSGGRFGPFAGQLFIAELTLGQILRAELEEVEGVTQGWVTPFRADVGSACRVAFAPDGSLFAGLTNRGWGGLAPADGVARIRWSGEQPFAVRSVSLTEDGFALEFTEPLADDATLAADGVHAVHYDYEWWWEYGSPVRNRAQLACSAVEISDDRLSAQLVFEVLEAGRVVRVRLPELASASGGMLENREFAYTVNRLRGGGATVPVAKRSVPPPSKEDADRGLLRLTWGDAYDSWIDPSGWTLCDTELDIADPSKLLTSEGFGALVHDGLDSTGPLVSRYELGDHEARIEFYLPEQGAADFLLQGRYAVRIADQEGDGATTLEDCGALPEGTDFAGRAPDLRIYRGAGRWHELIVHFRAPHFDAEGVRTAPARFESVTLDGELLHSDVELPGPTGSPLFADEAALGPYVVRALGTQVALRGFVVRALDAPRAVAGEDGWVAVFDGETLDDWQISDDGAWSVEDGAILGSGGRSHVFSPRGDYTDFEVLVEARINDNGNSGLYGRASFGPGWPAGYEAQINSSFPDPQKTGSIYALAPVLSEMIPPDMWFEQRLLIRETPEGTYLRTTLNGVVVGEHLDTQRLHASGHLALQQHHQGSEVRVRRMLVREL